MANSFDWLPDIALSVVWGYIRNVVCSNGWSYLANQIPILQWYLLYILPVSSFFQYSLVLLFQHPLFSCHTKHFIEFDKKQLLPIFDSEISCSILSTLVWLCMTKSLKSTSFPIMGWNNAAISCFHKILVKERKTLVASARVSVRNSFRFDAVS